MMIHVTAVQWLGGYRLKLVFNTGEEGIADLESVLDGPMFSPLRDLALFGSVSLDPIGRTVNWANSADLAPEYLLDLMKSPAVRAA